MLYLSAGLACDILITLSMIFIVSRIRRSHISLLSHCGLHCKASRFQGSDRVINDEETSQLVDIPRRGEWSCDDPLCSVEPRVLYRPLMG